MRLDKEIIWNRKSKLSIYEDHENYIFK